MEGGVSSLVFWVSLVDRRKERRCLKGVCDFHRVSVILLTIDPFTSSSSTTSDLFCHAAMCSGVFLYRKGGGGKQGREKKREREKAFSNDKEETTIILDLIATGLTHL